PRWPHPFPVPPLPRLRRDEALRRSGHGDLASQLRGRLTRLPPALDGEAAGPSLAVPRHRLNDPGPAEEEAPDEAGEEEKDHRDQLQRHPEQGEEDEDDQQERDRDRDRGPAVAGAEAVERP